MKKLKEVLRLKFELHYPNRLIAQSVNISPGTVCDYVNLFKVLELPWQEAQHLDEDALRNLVFGQTSLATPTQRVTPDWAKIHLELGRKGVTLSLLWREYKNEFPQGLGYTQFCNLYRGYRQTLDPVMHFNHKAGEKAFVDYSGLKMTWAPSTDEIHDAEIFVGCLGASHLIYAEATASQALPDWIASHIRMFEYFGGVSEMLIPDNLKSGTHKAHRYDPDLNPTYALFAEHYGTAIVPARIVRPRDKAKVENAVQCVQREIIAPLRHVHFTSLNDLNQAIKIKLTALNERRMQRIELSRFQQFQLVEKEALKPLPLYRFELQEWKKAKVHVDYHVCVCKHFYSVPYRLIGQHVEVCLTKTHLEIFHQSQRVAAHLRDDTSYRYTTLTEHMPPKHQHYLLEEQDASITYLLEWASKVGVATAECVKQFFLTRAFPQQAIRAVQGLKRLAHRYGDERFECACQQTLVLERFRYQTLESILKNQLDIKPVATTKSITVPEHFRGADYYQST